MFFPKLTASPQQRRTVDRFLGLDRRAGSAMGSFQDMENLWAGGYPALETRPPRGTTAVLKAPHGLVCRDAPVWVDGTALYVNGDRTGLVLTEGGKQLVEIAGKPILTWSAEAFDAVGDVGLIVIVCPEERMHEYLSRAIDPFPFVTPVVLAPSGAIRQESAFSGLEMVGDEYEYVVLHDGARPLVSPDLIEHTINMVKGNFDADGAIVAHPAVDTLKVVEDGVVVGTPDRSVFWNAQTPQVFRAGIYRRAHASALSDGFVGTDDSSLIERLGGKVLIVEGKRDNIKLTVPEDYVLLASAVRTMLLNSEHR